MTSSNQTLSTLLQRASVEDHEQVLKACNATLKQSKRDLRAQHAKVVALLKLDLYDDALQFLDEADDGLIEETQLERAYALYKTGQLEEAKSIAKDIVDSRGARHIEAQASYRSEDFVRASKLYRDLASRQAVDYNEENDLKINDGATNAQLEWSKNGHLVQNKRPGREELEAFETAFNAACACIARGELGQGEVLLKRSEDLCNALDDLSDEEKLAEVLPIRIQQLYVLSRLGKTEEAEHLASNITLQNISDPATRFIAQNNVLAATRDAANSYLSHRQFHSVPPISKTDTLFSYQRDRRQQNSIILDLQVLKYSGVSKSTFAILNSIPSSTISSHLNNISVLNAAARAQMQLSKLGLKKIIPLLEKRPYDVGLAMTVVQLYILTNNHSTASAILEALLKQLDASISPVDQDVRFAPGLIATLVSLYSVQGRKSQLKTELAKAASYWRHKSKPPTSLLQAAGLALLQSKKADDQASARDIFSVLYDQESTSKFATAGYVAAHAMSSSSLSKEADVLSPTSRLVAGIDVGTLEAAGVPVPLPSIDAASRKRALDEKPKPAKKRFRLSKLPKDYDVNKTPDPERWLPLRERSNYRPKGKKGRQKVAALTQGGVEKGGDVGASGGSKPSDGVIKAPGGGKVKNKKKTKK